METQGKTTGRRPGIQEISQSVGGAVVIGGLGVVAAFASVLVTAPLYTAVDAMWSGFGRILTNYVVQPGFGLVAAGYIWWCDGYNPLDRVRTPSVEGVAWISLAPIAYELSVRAITLFLPMIGLSHGGHNGEMVKWRAFLNQPELIIPGLVIMFLVMAPIEELLYRGVIHDALGETIGSSGRVLAGGLIFGGIHLFISGNLNSILLTSVFGFLLSAGYERTENLVVPVMAHAGYWLFFVPL